MNDALARLCNRWTHCLPGLLIWVPKGKHFRRSGACFFSIGPLLLGACICMHSFRFTEFRQPLQLTSALDSSPLESDRYNFKPLPLDSGRYVVGEGES